jgi:MFS family permease
MALIAPDLLAEVTQLSVGACVIGAIVGVLLWFSGWWQHRFWSALTVTAGAGLAGLQAGRAAGVQPLVAGLLAALAAGWLALELTRLLAFIAAGVSACALVQTFLPSAAEPLLTFLAGGLAGVLLFRLGITLMTSFVGTVVVTYAALGLASHVDGFNVAVVAEQQMIGLNAVVGIGTLGGVLLQSWIERWRSTRSKRRKQKLMNTLNAEERAALQTSQSKKGWFGKPRAA